MLLGLLFILILVILLPYSLELIYRRCEDDDQLKIIIWIWKLPLKIRISYINWLGNLWVSMTEIGTDRKNLDVEYKISLDQIIQLIIQPIPKYIRILITKASFLFRDIKKLRIHVKYSTGDAALTAIVVGISWSVLANVLGRLDSVCIFRKNPAVQVIPKYGAPMFELRIHCIFQIHLGHIITKKIQCIMGKGGYKFGGKSSH